MTVGTMNEYSNSHPPQAFLMDPFDQNPPLVLSSLFIIGTEPQSDYILQEPSFGRSQIQIEWEDMEYKFRVQVSPTSLFPTVNGRRVQEIPLKDGDEIRIGSKEFVFSLSDSNDPTHHRLGFKSKNKKWDHQLCLLGNIARSDFSVLLTGPTGSGKDLVARSLHQNSQRKHGPFFSVNCSAITESLFESELFGHIKGSFTGAISDRKGAFETARGGTLFLDEIGDIPLTMQAKLLRAIENQEVRPVGSDRLVKTNVRIIAATHQNLLEKIHSKEFRSDLYYRLNVVNFNLPSLQERKEDFEDLFYRFAKQYRTRFNHEAISKLKEYAWPGNIRQLKNTIARAAALFPGLPITTEHLPLILDQIGYEDPIINSNRVDNSKGDFESSLSVVKEMERKLIIKRLTLHQGNQKKTAADLNMPRSTLNDRLRQYNIDVQTFKT